MPRKIYKALTKEQEKRGVILSSTLSNSRIEREGDTTHEVFSNEPASEMVEHERRLKDDKFFEGYKAYNIIRTPKRKKLRQVM